MIRTFNQYNEWKKEIIRDLETRASWLAYRHGMDGFDEACNEMSIYLLETVFMPNHNPDHETPFYMARNIFEMIGVPDGSNVGQASRQLILRASLGCTSISE